MGRSAERGSLDADCEVVCGVVRPRAPLHQTLKQSDSLASIHLATPSVAELLFT